MDLSIRRATEADAGCALPAGAGLRRLPPLPETVRVRGLRCGAILADEDANLSVAVVDGQVAGDRLGFDHYAFYANGRVLRPSRRSWCGRSCGSTASAGS